MVSNSATAIDDFALQMTPQKLGESWHETAPLPSHPTLLLTMLNLNV